MASFINKHFYPSRAVDADEITCSDGVTAMLELCAMVLGDPGNRDAIMLGGPIYGSFGKDLVMRTG
jgi:1-aminocyclopropane-1-carboxylate synthase